MASLINTPAERGCSFLTTIPTSIFTPEQFTPDERLMIEMAEQFSRKEVLPLASRLDGKEAGLMPGLIRKAGELGFCGIDAPERFGGLGLGKNIAARILEYLSLDASFSVTVGITSGISLFGLIAFGEEAQKAKYLPKLTSGEWIGAYALSEPNSGTDALAMTTKAVRVGDKWILNGTKMWISNAMWADFFLVMAKIDGEHVSAFLVERNFPGVSIGREEHKMGLHASSTARLVLENAEVPLENLLYQPGKGHHVAFNALNMGRFKLGAMSIGPAREAMRVASIYAKDRKQFGQPIANFGLIQQKFADMAALFFAAETVIYRTGALIDHAFEGAEDSIEGYRGAAEEFAIECSICKVLATEVEAFIVDEALQVFGGYGFTEEFPIARIYRDARVSRIYEGTNEINRVFIADRLNRRIVDGRASLPGASAGFIGDLMRRAWAHYSPDQVVLGALADLAILVYAAQSVQVRGELMGGLGLHAAARFTNWANVRAAAAFATVTGEAVTVPAPDAGSITELAEGILGKDGPL